MEEGVTETKKSKKRKNIEKNSFLSCNINIEMSTTNWDPKEHVSKDIIALLSNIVTITKSSSSVDTDTRSNNNNNNNISSSSSSGYNNYNYPLAFFHIVQNLKLQKRTGWLNNGISPTLAESISDHMYRMAMMAFLLRDKTIDRHKCMLISFVHDIAESLVGDITPFDTKIDKNEKHLRESKAIQYLCDQIIAKYNKQAGEEIKERWLDYEEQRCIEAVYAKDLDKFEMLVQCFEYEKSVASDCTGKNDKTDQLSQLEQFYDCIDQITTEEVKGWLKALLKEREDFFIQLKSLE